MHAHPEGPGSAPRRARFPAFATFADELDQVRAWRAIVADFLDVADGDRAEATRELAESMHAAWGTPRLGARAVAGLLVRMHLDRQPVARFRELRRAIEGEPAARHA